MAYYILDFFLFIIGLFPVLIEYLFCKCCSVEKLFIDNGSVIIVCVTIIMASLYDYFYQFIYPDRYGKYRLYIRF
jgi:hypothetical protein